LLTTFRPIGATADQVRAAFKMDLAVLNEAYLIFHDVIDGTQFGV
jgi:hypothetical protein